MNVKEPQVKLAGFSYLVEETHAQQHSAYHEKGVHADGTAENQGAGVLQNPLEIIVGLGCMNKYW